MNLSDYIKLPREQRIAHIDLLTPCNCWRGSQSYGKVKARTELLNYLELTPNMKGYRSPCCHLCNNGSTSGQICVNPLHTYIGTPTENNFDIPRDVYIECRRKANAKRTPEERRAATLKGHETRRRWGRRE